ncbi:MAG: 4a-hydroxytetrahydrobiopterin dehydratase [Candidatus Hydrogenedentota bacterium]|jgi:4a-hydroxytetrahydrobiopterin dehydratase|uniref:Putative pterin-4-alpha-carbinolamine dehydratase n=1 Tax=Sumerlaea chitinivorans TaxID=2250252 RepID=A0A2Z4Y200_SUMC1|nr:Pterin-4-alpha-carbinolamine dehydratase [Candidatus Sumerlaea chitinivorans]MCX7963498.1 4a-hydroxytetrahydrobiopterin dehydratase [Candidatus Sumerlaea chitinivorans]RMH29346.1 MAG: 4a-hydroxytetrahydrobiopterin dehydratase [Candidatus Hydrogenedentota bacterium]GIX45438.1 MAG: putative pterin-4-alpha-carbinolamine dehydratase [Candidatus Sumerlaea sp.]
MTQHRLLSEEVIQGALQKLPSWHREEGKIIRDYTFADFRRAIEFVNLVAELAEQADHHPDILIHGWNKVRITLTTHSAGGITQNDIELARKIEEIVVL